MTTPIKVTAGLWPKRIGLTGVMLDPPERPAKYPWKGLGPNEVVIALPNDPYRNGPKSVVNHDELDREWSCVISRSHIEVLP